MCQTLKLPFFFQLNVWSFSLLALSCWAFVHSKPVTTCTSWIIAGQSNISTYFILSFQNPLVCQGENYSSPLSSFKDLSFHLKYLWQKICLSTSLRRGQLPKPFILSTGSEMGFLNMKWRDFEPIVSLPQQVRRQDFYPFWKGENCNLLVLASELWDGWKQQMQCHGTGTVKKGIWERVLWHMPRPLLFESESQKHPVLLDELENFSYNDLKLSQMFLK